MESKLDKRSEFYARNDDTTLEHIVVFPVDTAMRTPLCFGNPIFSLFAIF